ncbi:hypothetical protein NQ317_010761 [Molorchus minor]|uniref:Uncharacterized protein n=1 Tax=Molorchus minor TaxID=1323400 RepID=A0ABQ9IR84_9CUCU|nr:hypothetical protein NQ317_010761 [Molorchus minor]
MKSAQLAEKYLDFETLEAGGLQLLLCLSQAWKKLSLTRQKTILSLSKLSKLASPNSPDIDFYVENINSLGISGAKRRVV